MSDRLPAGPSRRRRGPLLIAGGIVAAVVLLAVAAVVIVGGRRTPAANQAVPTVTPTTDSVCGLRGTPGPSTSGATQVRWDEQTGWPLPISATDGPATRDPAGPWSCFAHTPSGAVLAAYVISIRVAGVAEHWQEVARRQTVPGAGQDALIKAGLSQTTPVTPRGFSVSAYDGTRATVALYLHSSAGDATCTTDVRWQGGDWKIEVQADGSTATGCNQQVPTSFTPWGP